jgi:hypothetical protein
VWDRGRLPRHQRPSLALVSPPRPSLAKPCQALPRPSLAKPCQDHALPSPAFQLVCVAIGAEALLGVVLKTARRGWSRRRRSWRGGAGGEELVGAGGVGTVVGDGEEVFEGQGVAPGQVGALQQPHHAVVGTQVPLWSPGKAGSRDHSPGSRGWLKGLAQGAGSRDHSLVGTQVPLSQGATHRHTWALWQGLCGKVGTLEAPMGQRGRRLQQGWLKGWEARGRSTGSGHPCTSPTRPLHESTPARPLHVPCTRAPLHVSASAPSLRTLCLRSMKAARRASMLRCTW